MNISDVTNAKKIGEFYINQAFLKTRDYKRPPKIKLLQTNLINLDFASKENIDDFLGGIFIIGKPYRSYLIDLPSSADFYFANMFALVFT